jgi:CHAT domain-containing protein/tetratricopeptide (TPR) repeat protein
VIALGAWLVVTTLTAQPALSDSLRRLAQQLSDSALVDETRKRPLETREALVDLLASVVKGSPASREAELFVAARLAGAYAVAWRDSFLVRQVERFTAASVETRAAKVAADSMRRVGVAVFGGRGPGAAIAIWRRALARANAIGDSASAAATAGNIGAAYARLGRTDSATAYLGRARALSSAVGDMRVEANTLAELAGLREVQDDPTAARDGYARAIALRQRTGDTRGLAADYNNLGLLAERVGDPDGARGQFEAALALNRREGRDVVAATNLVNLAGLDAESGDFAHAAELYREALATWRAREQWNDVADALRGLGQLELRRGDYPKARADLLEALVLYNRGGLLVDALSVRRDLAGALAAAGDAQGALDELRRAQRLADSANAAPAVLAGIALARADLAIQLNGRAAADRLYASAQALYHRAGDRQGEADAQHGRGILFLGEDNFVRARELLGAAIATQHAAGNERAASLTRLSLGELSLRVGDTIAARRDFSRASAELDRLGDPIGAAAAVGERAALEAAARFPVAAESLFLAALGRAGRRTAPQVTWQLHAGLAALRQRQGALDEAAREFRASIADIERTAASLAAAERRSAFLADKADVYLQLAMLERSRGRVAIAFELSERVRSREMLELLARGRVALPLDTAAPLIAREQDLRRRIAELMGGLTSVEEGKQPVRGPDMSAGNGVTREALVRAQDAYTELLLEMRDRAPRHAALVSRDGPNVGDVAQRLSADDAFIEFLVTDTASLAFVITRDTVAAVDLAVGRHTLATMIDFVRGTLRPRGSPRLDSLWRAPLRQLHQRLIAPLEEAGLLKRKTRLTIVAHGDLHYLPFAALVDGATGRFLVERYEVVLTPSAAVWLALGARPAGRAVAGMLALAPRPDALPASRLEVAAVGRLGGPDVRVLVGKAASEESFRREAPTRRVLHLATYGVLNKQNPLFSFVDLAPGGADDGRLEAHEVFGLALTADLVVLSACQTALGSGALADVPAGDDWVGLSRAFLHAGATRVVASLWAVEDRATATLMERFYREYAAGASPATALALAQRALLVDRTTAHPFYWAGFQLVGER